MKIYNIVLSRSDRVGGGFRHIAGDIMSIESCSVASEIPPKDQGHVQLAAS